MNTTNESSSPLTNAVVQLTGEDGNAFSIISRVRRAILKSNRPELAGEFIREAMASDYDHLLIACMRYVTVD